jgi:signal transduction histidine kinase
VALPGGGPEGAPLQIEFAGIDFAPGGRLRYEYRLDGIDRDWSVPSDQRSVVYARLPAGAYRFRVRAVANDGSVGAGGAEVRFTVLPPLWRRPEILALLFVGLGAAAYALHRIRLERAIEIERVRTRVARDLHDDIGAGLSEIAILSEVVRGGARDQTPLLAEIGDRARGLVDSMSDIVWSTDPRKDDVSSLVQRIRRFGANALESRGISWSLEVPEDFEARRMDPDQRRQIFLIVKEALTNAARHSGCRRAAVRILPAADAVSVEIEDDGSGFSPADAGATSGHGLANMRGRAAAVNGELELDSPPSGGTRIRLRVPLRRSKPPLSA